MFLQPVCCYWRKLALVAFVRFLPRVNFHMCSQIACLNCGIATLVTFVWFLSSVYFEMYPQFACLGRCILALTAFKGFLPGMSFQMCPQISCLSRCKVTLIAFVGFFSCLLCHVNFLDFREESAHAGDNHKLLNINLMLDYHCLILMTWTLTFLYRVHYNIRQRQIQNLYYFHNWLECRWLELAMNSISSFAMIICLYWILKKHTFNESSQNFMTTPF